MGILTCIKSELFELLKQFYSELVFYQSNKSSCERNSELLNIREGRSCYILGSGPSIKKQDLSKLVDQDIFFLNNFIVNPYFTMLSERPNNKYYVIAPVHPPQQYSEWSKWLRRLDEKIPVEMTCLFGLNARQKNAKYILEKESLFLDKKMYWYYASRVFDLKNKKGYGNIERPISKAEAVSVYAIIIAIFMGYKQIYLLGMDHDYFLYDKESDMRMYKSAIHQKDELNRAFGGDFYIEEFYRQYKIFKKYQWLRDSFDVEIYNASAGGILKVFKKIDYDSIFTG